ncbi:PH domain-containing protein [Streptomyces sp. NPDC051211]|uniref:PH domain-containing protein n=1 Tax=Streptomyces sp. NPDC051211 TaxID=3154643 RepID=UPI00344C94EF
MTSPSPASSSDEPVYQDRVYRSPMAIVGGVLLLALLAWLCGDAIVRGKGNAPWFGVAGALLTVPLTVAFTLRPAVFAGPDRMRVRNPFRSIELPWAAVDTVRSGYSAEVLTENAKYQLWAIPVSLRDRKKANRQIARREALARKGETDPEVLGTGTPRAQADRHVDELRELAEQGAKREGAQGPATVRWAYEIIAPAVAGAVLMIVLLATR